MDWNSIRHNLSLHERFFRLKGEETSGKSSWWAINKAAGTGRTTRRKTSGKKRVKRQSSAHKTLLKKLTNSNSSAQYFSSATTNNSLQNLPNFPNSTNRRLFLRSSTSSEDNESLQSIGSSYSPSCNENEMMYRETFQSSQATNKELFDVHPVHAFNGEYATSASDNATYLSSPDTVNKNASNSSGVNVYYPSSDKLYSQYYNELNPSYDYSQKSMSTDETGFSTVSAEYFKSPHHLSGSFMTSEVSRVDSIYNNTPVLDKPDSFLIIDLSSHTVHESPNLIETFDSNQSSVFLSPESQNLIKVPFVSDYPLEINKNMSLNDLNQKFYVNESDTFLEKENIEKMHANNERLQNNFKFYCSTPHKIKSEQFEEKVDDFSELTELSQESDSLKSPNYFCSDTIDHEYLNQIPGYVSEQESGDNTDGTQIQNEIIRFQPNLIKYQKQYSQEKDDKNVSYNPKQPIWNDNSEHRILSKCNSSENCPDNKTASEFFSGVEEIIQQSTVNSNENVLICPSDCEKHCALDSCLSTNNTQENKNVGKRKSDENNECSPDNLKRSKLECSPKALDSGTKKLNTVSVESNYIARKSEIEETGKTIFHQHLDLIIYHLIKLVMLHVENLELTKSAVNSTFAFLHALRLQTSQKKILVVLSELLFTIKLTYKCHKENGSVMYSNRNRFFADLMFSHFGYEVDFNSVVCLYINALDAFISEDFAEKHLEESMKKYDDILPNLVMYLNLYLTGTSVIEHVNDGNLVKDPVEVRRVDDFENFVPSSIYYRGNIHEICDEIKLMWNRRDSYVNHIEYFIRRRFLENDIKIHPPLYNPSLRTLLDAIKLQPKYKLLSSNLAAALVDTAKINFRKINNLKENVDCNGERVKSVKIFENLNILPSDLSDIQLLHNFELECDFRNIDFDFSNYDSSYDKYL